MQSGGGVIVQPAAGVTCVFLVLPAPLLALAAPAARAGDVPALLKLVDAYATGRSVRQHDVKALELYQQAAVRLGVPQASAAVQRVPAALSAQLKSGRVKK